MEFMTKISYNQHIAPIIGQSRQGLLYRASHSGDYFCNAMKQG